ncbi:hypothetical protein AVM11_08110 [Sphingomonas melonis TY]|jgi:hypothetical protein|uniref:Uncharacterized protein n=3 Tax=Sphingomonas melonis TaxID=152682 RepID=A0A0D1MC65_9SPHN|nr:MULTISPECIES: hypothetical protein [Sphingomonas]AOW25474.1 hypothetical protein BJP26_05360 [Sphingomonas melonis TY]ATI56491.1 hypothetical protein CP552_12585 [Sphingomonas melonis]KIU28147.1 hypothetical protein SR41_08910 [Sphingomonas melonis]KZB94499.1 hypothetical protein AVM11_08110 [Sphingomonas melonis TY]MBX8845373.1 hypothetical protein [Sphingomonas melonis]
MGRIVLAVSAHSDDQRIRYSHCMGQDRELDGQEGPIVPRGCGITAAIWNLIIMGLVALSFASGPYSSFAQMAWYRLGSISFLLLGAVIPSALLFLLPKRCSMTVPALTAWMIAAFVIFAWYMIYSGGGV